jgi:colanic acid biosynthesis glycosyl transferase WcaI
MRILFLGLNYAPEEIGIGFYSGDMTGAWVKAGYDVRAVVAVPYYPAWKVHATYAGKGWQRSIESGVDLTRCPIYVPAKPSGMRRLIHHMSFLATALPPMVAAALGRRRPDLVFTVAPSLISAPVAWLVSRLSGTKCWLHIQDFEIEAALATGLVSDRGGLAKVGRWFEQRVIGLFDHVSSISPQMCAKLVEKGVPRSRIYELRNWADIGAITPYQGPSPYRARWGITTPHVALYSGNIANKQGIDIVLDAARLLRGRTDLTFIICGQGPNRAALEELASDLTNIQFHDLQERERLNELLGLATVHLMPQLAGAADLVLPSKLTNMLASGRPVVATAEADTGLAEEIVDCGIITQPGSAKAFAEGIEALLKDPALAARYGENGRQRAEKRWAKEQILARLDAELADVVAEPKVTHRIDTKQSAGTT